MKDFYKVAVGTYKGVFSHCTIYYTDGTWRCYSRVPKRVASFIARTPDRVSGEDDYICVKFWGESHA